MSLTVNTRTYNANRVNPDTVEYVGASNTLSVKDTVTLKRTAPKVGVTTPVARATARITRTVVKNSTTGETGDLIFDVNLSCPTGPSMTQTMIDDRLADLAAWLNTADSKSLFGSLKINF